MRHSTPRPSFLAIAAALAASPLLAQTAPPGQTLLDEVEQAYGQTEQYQADVRMTIEQDQGRWHIRQWADMPVAFDRPQSRLRVDKPDFLLVVSDKLRLRSEQAPGNHLEVEAPESLTYGALQESVPFLGDPPLIDLVFLLSDDPVATLTGGIAASVTTLPPEEGDAEGRQRLQIPTGNAVFTLSIDPETKLIERAVVEPPSGLLAPGDSMRVVYDYAIEGRNEALPEDTFAFDTQGSTARDSAEAFVAAAAGGGAAAGGASGGASGGGDGASLVGEDAPAIQATLASGEAFSLADADADVVVLDFWATWCPPCRRGLPELQKVADWAEAEGKRVLIATVNVGETKQQAQAYFREHGLAMPIVLDPNSEIADAYGVVGIPQTVVIAHGKVTDVHVGFSPGIADTLKAEINAALEADAE